MEGGGGSSAQKQQVMDQVRNQVAVANAQELLQVNQGVRPRLHHAQINLGPFTCRLPARLVCH